MTTAQKKEWIGKCWATHIDIGFGCRQYMLFTPEQMWPIGVVWAMTVGGKNSMSHVLDSYVNPSYRRRGVRTRINEYIFTHVNGIQTWQGSKEGGEKFLKASGYLRDKVRGDWWLGKKR